MFKKLENKSFQTKLKRSLVTQSKVYRILNITFIFNLIERNKLLVKLFKKTGYSKLESSSLKATIQKESN